MSRQFVGLGRLGISMVGTLDSWGHEVLAIPSPNSTSRRRWASRVTALKPKGGPGSLPRGDTILHEGDVLVVGGSKKAIDRSPRVEPDGR